jgi:hypothetical protein
VRADALARIRDPYDPRFYRVLIATVLIGNLALLASWPSLCARKSENGAKGSSQV